MNRSLATKDFTRRTISDPSWVPLLPTTMERTTSALQNCADTLRNAPSPCRSDVSLQSNPGSSNLPLQELVTTRRTLSISKNTVKSLREPVRLEMSNLPIEIVLIVAEYLSPSNVMSLTYSCARFRKAMGVSIEKLLGKKDGRVQLARSALQDNLPRRTSLGWTLPTGLRDEHHSERLNLLCMLDRDQKIPQSRAVCSSCADTHDRSLFSSDSLAQSSRERRCLGSAGRIWVCPHWIFDHNLVTTSTDPRESHQCGYKGVSVWTFDKAAGQPVRKQPIVPVVIRPMVSLRDKDDPPSKEHVNDVLHRMNLSICKHLRSTDAGLLQLYSPDCLYLRRSTLVGSPDCKCQACVWRLRRPSHEEWTSLNLSTDGKCKCCGTLVCFYIFTIGDQESGVETLWLLVERDIRGFGECTDRAWIESVDDPAEFERLEREWKAANSEAGGLEEGTDTPTPLTRSTSSYVPSGFQNQSTRDL